MDEKKKTSRGYRKIRYYLLTENVFIVLAFLLLAVGAYNIVEFGPEKWLPYFYLVSGVILLFVGITIALKMVRAFQREDIPAYDNILESDDVDPESGLLYYDNFLKQAELKLQMSLTGCYLASIQIEGIEHLRHFVGYQKAADTMAEIGEVFKNFQKEKGNNYVIAGCKSGHEFLIMVYDCEQKEMQNYLMKILSEINETLLRLATAENFVAYCGYSCYPQQASSMEELSKFTSYAVYEAVMFHKSEPRFFSPDSYKRQESEYMKDNKIKELLDKNELQYKFQPIVSAKTGKIYAYEALMRTKKDVGLSPTDVLELAQRQDRLYEVEHYTFYNVLKIMSEHASNFEKRRLFINSIPTVIIKENEFDELLEEYQDLMSHLVIEITENGMQSEESCAAVHKYMDKSGCELALDDYGTGYSNASTLLNNSPHYLKIDHSMVMGIDTDSKKQHLVGSYVSFANNHNMKILAEGVETPEELQMVIQLGCHLIQGFYTGRPNSEIVDRIHPDIENEIVAINLKLAKLSSEQKAYEASNFEKISIINLAIDFYSSITVNKPAVSIIGEKDREVEMNIVVEDNTETVITLTNVCMRGKQAPVITIGENCNVCLCIEGKNDFTYDGIRVPKSSKLTIQGNGNLTIHVDHNNGIGIGMATEEPYGGIHLSHQGTIRIETNGDVSIGIGGMLADEGSEIKMTSGVLEMIVNGSKSLGIGYMDGSGKIILDRCNLILSVSGADTVGIGTFTGAVDITSVAEIELDVSGSNATGIGCLQDKTGKIYINDGDIRINMHCMEGVAIGSMNGAVDTYILGNDVFVYAEGSEVGGIGNFRGYGDTYVKSGNIKVVLLAASQIPLGSQKGRLEITGGNIYGDLGDAVMPVNMFGMPVQHKVVESTEYIKKIETEEGVYLYRAKRSDLFENIHVYIPKFCNEIDIQT